MDTQPIRWVSRILSVARHVGKNFHLREQRCSYNHIWDSKQHPKCSLKDWGEGKRSSISEGLASRQEEKSHACLVS